MSDITKNENYIDIKERFKKSNKYMLTIDYTDIKFLFYYIDEQQKEIEELKDTLKCTQNSWYKDTKVIETQQKEIEELKEEVKRQGNTREIEEEFMEKNYISKDKIREKIKELEEDIEIHNIYEENWNKINVLKELLEE